VPAGRSEWYGVVLVLLVLVAASPEPHTQHMTDDMIAVRRKGARGWEIRILGTTITISVYSSAVGVCAV
jgi:hypothetical protein